MGQIILSKSPEKITLILFFIPTLFKGKWVLRRKNISDDVESHTMALQRARNIFTRKYFRVFSDNVHFPDSGIMPCRYIVSTHLLCPLPEDAELNFSVAKHIRIGR